MNVDSLPSLSSLFTNLGSTQGVKKSSGLDALRSLFQSEKPAKSSKSSSSTTDANELAGLGLGELESLARSAQAFRFTTSQSEFALSGDNFQARGLSQSARFEALIQQDDRAFKLTIEVERTVVGVAARAAQNGGDPLADAFQQIFDQLNSSADGGQTDLPADPADGAQKLLELAQKFLGGSSDDSSGNGENSSRPSLFDLVRSALDQGFDQASETLGNVPDSVQNAIDQTRSLFENNWASWFHSNNESPDDVARPVTLPTQN